MLTGKRRRSTVTINKLHLATCLALPPMIYRTIDLPLTPSSIADQYSLTKVHSDDVFGQQKIITPFDPYSVVLSVDAYDELTLCIYLVYLWVLHRVIEWCFVDN